MLTIMLVEDEKNACSNIKAKLAQQSADFTIIAEASSGNGAFELLARGRVPDVMMSDIRMTPMDGFEFINICRQRYPDMRIVVLSGYADFDDLRSAIRLGIKDYLLKPVAGGDLNKLLGKLREDIQAGVRSVRTPLPQWREDKKQLRAEQENILQQLVMEEWYSWTAVKKRLRQLRLTQLSANDWSAQLVVAELKLPAAERTERQERRDLLQYSFQMLCRETAYKREGVYPFPDPGTPSLMYFLVEPKKNGNRTSNASSFVQELQAHIGNVMNIECVYGIGAEIEGFKQLKNGYASAILDWSDSWAHLPAELGVNRVTALAQAFSPKMERKLTRAIEHVDKEEFRSHLSAILPDDSEVSLVACTWVALRLLLLFSSIAQKYEWNGSFLQKYLWGYQMTLPDCKSAEEIGRQIDDWAELVMKEVRITRSADNSSMSEVVRKYAERNFVYELSLSDVAGKYAVDEIVLSKKFKRHAGVSFSDYVTRLRVTKAGQLLQESTLKLANIAVLVGYSDPSLFSRDFKSYYGKNPKHYRERYGQKTQQGLEKV